MTERIYACRCVCKRCFTTLCPCLTECPRCAARRLLTRPVADTQTATERLMQARLHFEAHGNDDLENDGMEDDLEAVSEFAVISSAVISSAVISEFGAEPLPDEDDAVVTALLTGHRPPRRLGMTWLEYALGVMVTVVAALLWLTGGFH